MFPFLRVLETAAGLWLIWLGRCVVLARLGVACGEMGNVSLVVGCLIQGKGAVVGAASLLGSLSEASDCLL